MPSGIEKDFKATDPIAVLISDIHFTPSTLELASNALKQAIDKATELFVPLIIAGDTLDSKAIIRAECANRLIELLETANTIPVLILVGNHDLVNEKGEDHSLNFLNKYCTVVSHPTQFVPGITLIPYQNSNEAFTEILKNVRTNSTIICHQGVQTAYMGHYLQDTSSLPSDTFKDYRVISGHYHRRQDIKCGPKKKGLVGTYSYIGNPYTLTFGEANDGPKGFLVLDSSGATEFVPTNLRRHIIVDRDVNDLQLFPQAEEDKLWLKIRGSKLALSALRKPDLVEQIGHSNFKLDLIPTDKAVVTEVARKEMNHSEMFDKLINDSAENTDEATYLKLLWRETIK